MQYVEVLVADATFHGSEALTYSCSEQLTPGSVVLVPLRKKQVLGVVVAATDRKPAFAVKPIITHRTLPALPDPLLRLFLWLKEYYPAPMGIVTQLLLPKQLPKKPLPINPLPLPIPSPLPPLSNDQLRALQAVTTEGLHILHGETGTGKTRVYLELTGRQIIQGKSVLILTPEIGLTSQLANNFRTIYGERVLVIHSQLTDATRERLWQYTLEQQEPLIIIGARSALFSPLANIGLIVIDEAHETAYKQDQSPHYHATPIAAKLASIHQAALILGSATPLVSDYYVAAAKKRPIIRMQQPAKLGGYPERTTTVIDLRERQHFTKSPYLSSALLTEITHTLDKKEQSLIFLNRRGTARVVFCDKCAWQAACPHCDLPLVYHGDSHLMRCHSCDHKAPSPVSCPSCRNPSIVFKSVGTKAIVGELERLFPGTRIMRFDTDNKKDERMEQQYDGIHRGDVDIIVGTQTIAKGLDLPRLGLVGVVIADTGLFFPDFSAQERTYQLLSQVLGRVDRGHRHGRAIVQTYAPESPLLQAVLHKNWDSFYQSELTERRTFRFPPFCYLLKLNCRRSTAASAQAAAARLAADLQKSNTAIRIEGPAPAFHEKFQNKFSWQLIVKSNSRPRLTAIIKTLPSGWTYDIDPMNLL